MTTATYARQLPVQQPRRLPTLHMYTRLKPESSEHEKTKEQHAPLVPSVLTISEACEVLKISKWTLYRLIHSQQLKTIKIGSRRVVSVESIRRFVSNLEENA